MSVLSYHEKGVREGQLLIAELATEKGQRKYQPVFVRRMVKLAKVSVGQLCQYGDTNSGSKRQSMHSSAKRILWRFRQMLVRKV